VGQAGAGNRGGHVEAKARRSGQIFRESHRGHQHRPCQRSVQKRRRHTHRSVVAEAPDLPGVPAGYLLVAEVDGAAHLEQVSVDPAYTGQQLGRLLVEQAVAWARDHDYPAITLTTFTDVAWNGPWYTRLGFSAVEPLTGLRAIRDHEKAHGLDRWPRAAMRREV